MTGEYEGEENHLRRWSRMTELTVMLVTILGGVAVAVTAKPEDSGGVPSLRCRDTGLCLLPPAGCSFYPFFFLLPVCLSRSPYRYPQLFLSFNCYGPFSLKTVGLSLSRSLLPFFCLFFSLLHSGGIYRGRRSRVDPGPSHRFPCMGRTSPALSRCRQRWPMEASLAGHGCSCISSWGGWRLVLVLIEYMGGRGRDKGKKTKLIFPCCMSRGRRRRNSVASKRHRFISFCFWNAWNGVVFLKIRRFI